MDINKEVILKVIQESNPILLSSHNKLCIPIIKRIHKKMEHGILFDAIKVCDNLIIDGHHRFISSLLANLKLEKIKSLKTNATNQYDWTNVEFVEEEWDTEDKILILNELDALYNNIPLEKIIELTK